MSVTVVGPEETEVDRRYRAGETVEQIGEWLFGPGWASASTPWRGWDIVGTEKDNRRWYSKRQREELASEETVSEWAQDWANNLRPDPITLPSFPAVMPADPSVGAGADPTAPTIPINGQPWQYDPTDGVWRR